MKRSCSTQGELGNINEVSTWTCADSARRNPIQIRLRRQTNGFIDIASCRCGDSNNKVALSTCLEIDLLNITSCIERTKAMKAIVSTDSSTSDLTCSRTATTTDLTIDCRAKIIGAISTDLC